MRRSAIAPGQLAIQQFNDRDIGRYDMLTMQQAHDLTSHILKNPTGILGQSLPVANLKEWSEEEARTIKRTYNIPDQNPLTRVDNSLEEILMDRSFCISSFQNNTDTTDANKDFTKELLRFVGNDDQDRMSFALCSAPRIIKHEDGSGIWYSSEGNTHWTSLHVRKITNPDGTRRIGLFYADSMSTTDMPTGIKNAINNLNKTIQTISSEDDAKDFLTSKHYIELGFRGEINDANQLIINGLTMLGSAKYQLPTNATPVRCANQTSNTSGYGNTCCENALFNMFAMHYLPDLESTPNPDLLTSTGQDHNGIWNQFIANGRPTLQAIIEERRNASSTATVPLDKATEFSNRLSEIDNKKSDNVQNFIERIKNLNYLKNQIIHHLHHNDHDEKIFNTLGFAENSLEEKLRSLIKYTIESISDPETIIEDIHEAYNKYKDERNLDQKTELLVLITDIIQEKFRNITATSPAPPTPTPASPTPPATIDELDAIEEGIVTYCSPPEGGSSALVLMPQNTAILAKKLTDDVNKYSTPLEGLTGPTLREEFTRPKAYCGIGALTTKNYNSKSKQFEFTITEIFEGSLAQQIGLKIGEKITYPSQMGDVKLLQQAVQAIRKIALLKAENTTIPYPEDQDLIDKIGLSDRDGNPIENKIAQIIYNPKITKNSVLIHRGKTFDEPVGFINSVEETKARIEAQTKAAPALTAPSTAPGLDPDRRAYNPLSSGTYAAPVPE